MQDESVGVSCVLFLELSKLCSDYGLSPYPTHLCLPQDTYLSVTSSVIAFFCLLGINSVVV